MRQAVGEGTGTVFLLDCICFFRHFWDRACLHLRRRNNSRFNPIKKLMSIHDLLPYAAKVCLKPLRVC